MHFLSYLDELLLEGEIARQNCRENQNTFYVQLYFPENRAVCEIMGRSIVEPDRLQMMIWRLCIAGWVRKATNTYTQYVMLIAFSLHQCLHERASILRFTLHTLPVLLNRWKLTEWLFLEGISKTAAFFLFPFMLTAFQWSFLLFSNISPLWSTQRIIIYFPASHRCSSSDLTYE